MKKWLCVAVTVFLFTLAGSAHAGMYDPVAGWRTIKTPHFRVHHPEKIRKVAQRAAHILEEIYGPITEEWNWKPWGYSEVIITDSSDAPNGLTMVLPYNWMIIYIVPPTPDSSLAHYDDWLRMLLIHEYTHLVQIDAYGGAWTPFRYAIGKTVSPSGINPVWMREGIAEYGETTFTKGGRGRGSFSEMVVRTSFLEDTFPAIDQADGLGWRWPGYHSSYIYGIKFVQWLVEHYGEERFMQLDRRIRSSLLLGMINHQARNVYDKTFYELWKEWYQDLTNDYAKLQAKLEKQGMTEPAEIILSSKREGQFHAPTLSPDGKQIVYTYRSPFGKPEVRLYDIASKKEKAIMRGQQPVHYSFSPDGKKLIFSSMARHEQYYNYYDLWLYTFGEGEEVGSVQRLTSGERGRDPEFDRSGKSVIFVAGEEGTDHLKRIDLETRKITVLTPNIPQHTQLANPRISPDGNFLVISAWKPDEGWRLYKATMDGTSLGRLTQGKGLAIESRPQWSEDGRSIIFASDESGIDNLYRVSADGGEQRQLTNLLTGAFQPTRPIGNVVYAQYYTSKGYTIARFEVPPAEAFELAKVKPVSKKKLRAEEGRAEAASATRGAEGDAKPIIASSYPIPSSAKGETDAQETVDTSSKAAKKSVEGGTSDVVTEATGGEEQKAASSLDTSESSWYIEADKRFADKEHFEEKKYSPFTRSLFLPRFVIPNVAYANDTIFASAFTGGSDVLRWHNWLAGATYRLDANFLGGFARYWYSRYKGTVGVMANRYAVDFGTLVFDTDGDLSTTGDRRQVRFFEKRHAAEIFTGYPFGRHRFGAAYYYEDHAAQTALSPDEKDALNLGAFAGFRFTYTYGDSERYPASISNENGRTIKLRMSVTDKYLGSGDRNEQIIFSGDWREYIKLGRRHVIALRGAGGITWGDQLVQGTFGMGGSIGEGALAGAGSFNYFPLRGLPVSALSRTRAMLFSSEYRFPIYSPLRGIGTVPVFLKEISGSLFADFGNAWNAHEGGSDSIKTFFDDFLLGVGAELHGDFIIGHGLPLHGRLGYGIIVVNRDRLSYLTDPILGSSIKYGMLILALGVSF